MQLIIQLHSYQMPVIMILTNKTKYMKTILFFAALILFIKNCESQPGTLDKSFGTGGKVITNFGVNSAPDIVKAVKQSDDKIIEAGHYDPGILGDPYGFLAVCFAADGALDYSYGDSGKTVIQFPFEDDAYVNGVAIQKDNKVLLSGYGYHDYFNPIYDGVITRLNTNGSVDSSFGTNGVIQTNINGYGSYGAIAVQVDGKLVVIGADGNSSFISRLLENGTVDKTFGESGYAYTKGKFGFLTCNIQTDGKIVVAGYDYQFSDRKFCLQRYLPDGTMDKSFGDNGTVITSYGDDGLIQELAFQSDGKIVVTGQTTIYAPYNTFFATARYNQDGSMDNSFGTNGKTTTMFGDSLCISNSILVLKDDKIIVAGYKQIDNATNFAMVRLTVNGISDSSFGNNGKAVTDFDNGSAIKSALLQSNGKIIAAGVSVLPSFFSCALARYNNNVNNKQPLAIRIKRWLQHHGISWQGSNNVRYYAVQRSADGIVYKEIAKLANSSNNYEDAAPLTGSTYYRLAAIAKDGSRTYSNTVLIDEGAQVKMFPNPVRDNLQLQGLATGGKTAVSVVDLQGNVRATATAGGSSYSLSTSNLSPGNYLLKLQHNGTVTTQAFVKE